MGKTKGIFLNLSQSSVYINKTDQSPYQFQHLADRFDSAVNKLSLTH